jgi:FkbM family methyltransferase
MDRPFRSFFGGGTGTNRAASTEAQLAELARALGSGLAAELERLVAREVDRAIAAHLAVPVREAMPAAVRDGLAAELHRLLAAQLGARLPLAIEEALRGLLEPALSQQLDALMPRHVERALAKELGQALAAELDLPLAAQLQARLPSAVQQAVARSLAEPAAEALAQLTEASRRLQAVAEARPPEAQLAPLLPWTTLDMLRGAPSRAVGEAAIRARCQVVNLDARTALCRVLGRYKMFVDLRDAGFAPHLMFEGYWEYWNTEYVWEHVRAGDVCIDVGANHGYFTLLLGDLVGAGGTVHALEPNPRLYDLMSRTVALNGFARHVHAHQAGAGATRGELPLLVPLSEPKNARLISEEQALMPVVHGLEEIHRVPVIPLDDITPGPVDFIKIDVEGAEEAVWAGMQKLLDRSPKVRIAMELNPGRCRAPRALLAAITDRFPLREIGFDGRSHAITTDEILRRTEDTMLDLCAAPD